MRSRLLSRLVATQLVGRAHELDQLEDLGRRATTGLGAVVCVVGEPGIGKTSLLAATRAQLVDLGVDVHESSLDETDRRRPLSIVRSLLPNMAGPIDGGAIDQAIASVEQLAARGAIALLVDDLQWADDASLDVINAIARRAETLGVLLVATTRPQPMLPQVARFLELASAMGSCMRPPRLDDDHIAALVANRLNAVPGPRLLDALASTAGNPFLVTELVAGFVEEGQVITSDGAAELTIEAPLPGDLSRRLAMRTIAAVPGGELLVRAAAVMPGGVTVDELAELLDLRISEALVIALAAVDVGVLVDAETALMFRHDLLRQSVLEQTPSSIRRTLSGHAADVLIARGADPERVTACLLEGTDVDDPRDIDRLLTTGRSYLSKHPAAAADLLARAIEGLDRHDVRTCRTVTELGWAYVAAGRSGEVDGLLRSRVGQFRLDEPISIQRLRGIALALAGRIDQVAANYADLDADEAISRYDQTDSESVDAIAELAQLRASTGRMNEALQLLEWVDASPTPPSPNRTVTMACVRSLLAAVAGRFEDAAACARDALAQLDRDRSGLASSATSRLTLAIALDQLGDSAGALIATTEIDADRTMPMWGPPLLQCFAAVVLYRRGDWDDALAEIDGGMHAADEAGLGMAAFWPPSTGALVATARGDAPAAHAWLEQANAATSSLALGREWLALATALTIEADGDCAGAAAILAATAEAILAADLPALLLNGGPEMVRLLLDDGRTSLAERVTDALASLTEVSGSPIAAALADWSAGLIASDPHLIVQAAETLTAVPRVPEAARAFSDGAVVTARVGLDSDARLVAKRAFELFDGLGAQYWWQRLRTQLRADGLELRPRRGPARATVGWGSLTASEQTIVGFVGEGLTNTEIAARLVVSRRTVESHLGRVYTKMQFTSRAQLVAAAARRVQAGVASAS